MFRFQKTRLFGIISCSFRKYFSSPCSLYFRLYHFTFARKECLPDLIENRLQATWQKFKKTLKNVNSLFYFLLILENSILRS